MNIWKHCHVFISCFLSLGLKNLTSTSCLIRNLLSLFGLLLFLLHLFLILHWVKCMIIEVQFSECWRKFRRYLQPLLLQSCLWLIAHLRLTGNMCDWIPIWSHRIFYIAWNEHICKLMKVIITWRRIRVTMIFSDSMSV